MMMPVLHVDKYPPPPAKLQKQYDCRDMTPSIVHIHVMQFNDFSLQHIHPISDL